MYRLPQNWVQNLQNLGNGIAESFEFFQWVVNARIFCSNKMIWTNWEPKQEVKAEMTAPRLSHPTPPHFGGIRKTWQLSHIFIDITFYCCVVFYNGIRPIRLSRTFFQCIVLLCFWETSALFETWFKWALPSILTRSLRPLTHRNLEDHWQFSFVRSNSQVTSWFFKSVLTQNKF